VILGDVQGVPPLWKVNGGLAQPVGR
jgi:hypothetical protein